MQPYAIGLDVGITSVGWSVVALKEDRPCQIIGMGSRIFDAAENPKTGASLAAPRREARSVRRRLRRRRFRNSRIRDLLTKEKIVTEDQLAHLFEGRLEDIYALRVRALDEKMTGPEMARILIHLSQRRGFRSNRKGASAGEDGQLLKAVNKNIGKMADFGYRTVAEMLLLDEEFAENKRNKGGAYITTVSRDMVEAEARAIFSAQRAMGSPYAFEEIEEDYITILLSQRSFDDGPGKGSPYAGNQIERMIGWCTFEKNEKRASKASFSFEYFTLLQTVNHMQLVTARTSTPLTDEQRKTVIDLAMRKADINFLDVRKALELTADTTFNMVYYRDDDQKVCETKTRFPFMRCYHKIRKAFDSIEKNYIDKFSRDQLNALAEALIRYKTSECLHPVLLEKGFTDTEANAAEVLSFSGTGHISVKACEKIIPFMEQGMLYNEACEAAGYMFKGHDGNEKTKLLPPLNEDDKNEITSPVVLRAVSQTIKVVNAIIREMCNSPTFINLELAREMAKDFDERQKIRKNQESNRAENERVLKELQDTYHLVSPTAHDIVKLRMYEEQGGICPYSQKPIPVDILFDENMVQVDHVIPYSISFDDSRKNKVLVFAKENQEKGNRLPLQYLTDKRKDEYIVWVKNAVKDRVKRDVLLKETITEADRNKFKERNLQDTKHATAFLLNYITEHLRFEDFKTGRKKHVTAVNGSVTSYLRKRWGIAKIRANGDLHHAVDALIVACATDKAIQDISKYAKYRETRRVEEPLEGCKVDPYTGEIIKVYFPEPWEGFRKDLDIRMSDDPLHAMNDLEGPNTVLCRGFLRPIFVSRMANHKITGAAHAETVFSNKNQRDGMVIKKIPLTSLEYKNGAIKGYYNQQSDSLLYNALLSRLKKFDGKAKEAFKEPFRKPKKDGTLGPIVKSVKICDKSTMPVPVYNGNGIAKNDSIVRVDVFYAPNDGYYFVPIYIADTVKDVLPNKACIAHRNYTEWKEMNESDFIFSLYKNDLIRVEHKKGISLGKINKDSTIPDQKEFKAGLLYYAGANISTAVFKCITHDNCYEICGLGIKTLKSLEKWTVDVLGNVTVIKREKRMPFCKKK